MAATAATVEREAHVAALDALQSELDEAPAPQVAELRRRGAERFAALGFPTPRQEAWRFTNVARVADTPWRLAAGEVDAAVRAAVTRHALPDSHSLVAVDGRFDAALSATDGVPARVTAGSLAEALAAGHPAAIANLGRWGKLDADPFAALGTAMLADGIFVHVPRGVVIERPLHLVLLATAGGAPRASFPRLLLVFEEASQATVVESWIGAGEGEVLTVPVSEVVVGDGAAIDHVVLQREPATAAHVGAFRLQQGAASAFASHTFTLGGGLVRNDLTAVLAGEGADCILNGLYVISGQQHVDTQMTVEHESPHTSSHELYKGVLDGRSRAVFNGLIHVHKGAQKTDAKQSNRNLLISDEALVNSNPQLLIFADDVKCTHGSTVGQLDADAVFYLRSRGMSLAAAESLLTYAFAADVIGRVKVEAVRADLETFMFNRLPAGEVVRQAV